MEEKIKELAKKHNIPASLLKKVIQMEKERVILQQRRLVPEIRKVIQQYAALYK
ncbi:hypothetical protein I4641_20910 [Waterburya agarophytonicola K14]|uniref:Uncharacterized protein n=1 Tax=Waterburya agarophytonicola KI4 TaxID=2874699 RepID=A0A964FHV8_9CYAN|nr:hypothetical protein [Waterburya agarophytonicola]MCC0179426.1 hypothetical protein [Waterburya agarophytonicola KI4]